ncbi:uncharacterized protein LOC135160409 isoform X2 [Diachasmimorpha longicaudata]
MQGQARMATPQQQQMKSMQQQTPPKIFQGQQQQQQTPQKPFQGQQQQQQTPQKPFQGQQQQQQTPQKPFQGQQMQQTPQQTPQKQFGQPQQQQLQQQQSQQSQQQQQPQPTPEKKVSGPNVATPKPAAVNPSQNNTQGAPSTPASGQNQDCSMDYEDVMPEGDGFSETSDQPKWRRSKLQGTKVNRKLRRLRMNQRLRKTLMPKNAIMVLNEMKAGVQFTFPETQAVANSVFLVHAELDGKTYVGQGLSKPLARQNAAENALKCLLLEKMTAAANKARTDAENDPQGVPDNTETIKEESDVTTGAPVDTTNPDAGAGTPMNVDDTDEIPWSSLASFALYKLFLEWQNQGTVVPIPRPGTQTPPKLKTESKPPTEKVLPENALSVHPVMLLNQMKPGITYVEVSRSGNPPNTLFTLSVEIDDKVYTGAAKNKRDAKKIAAKAALKALYNLEYLDEIKAEVVEPMQVSEQMLQQPLQ